MKKVLFANIILIALIIINLGLAAVVVLNFKQSIHTNSELSILKSRIFDLKKVKISIENFKEAQTAQEEEALKKKLPIDSPVPLEAMKEIIRIAGKLQIQEINISSKGKAQRTSLDLPDVQILPFDVKLSCEYNKILDLFKELPMSPCLINVVDLKISRNSNKLPNLDIGLTLNTYTILTKKQPSEESAPGKGRSMPSSSFSRGRP